MATIIPGIEIELGCIIDQVNDRPRCPLRPATHTWDDSFVVLDFCECEEWQCIEIIVPMKLIKAIVRPNKVDEVKDALGKLSISGMTVTEVRGHGKQKGHTAVYRGKEYNVSLLPKMAVETVVSDGIVEEVIRAIIQAARTGEIGDGRVFVIPVEEAYRIRTGEKDPI